MNSGAANVEDDHSDNSDLAARRLNFGYAAGTQGTLGTGIVKIGLSGLGRRCLHGPGRRRMGPGPVATAARASGFRAEQPQAFAASLKPHSERPGAADAYRQVVCPLVV